MTKNRFNEIWSIVTEVKKNKLKTSLDGKEFTLDDAESLLEGIINRKTNGSEAKERYNNIDDDIFIILKSKVTKNQKKIISTLILLGEIFVKPRTAKKADDKTGDKADYKAGDDKTDNKTDGDKTDDEKSDITDMPDLKSKEFAEQRKNQKGQELKILTPYQMLTNFFSTIKIRK